MYSTNYSQLLRYIKIIFNFVAADNKFFKKSQCIFNLYTFNKKSSLKYYFLLIILRNSNF
jgi:hypothetical protein